MTNLVQQAEDDVRDLVTPADNTDPTPDAPQQAKDAQQEAKEEPKAPKVGGKFDDARERIWAKARAAREASDGAPDIEVISEQQKGMYGNVETEADRRRPADTAPAENVTADDIPAPKKKVLKVNGRDVEVDEAQIEDHARRSLAAEDILAQAKRERDEARQLLADLQKERAVHSASPQQQSTPAQASAEDSKPATNAELDTIIDAIQVGSREDAAAALAKYGDQLIKRMQENVGDLDERYEAAATRREENRRVAAEAEQVLTDFRTEFTEFETSEMRQRVLFDTTVEVMAEKMFEAGLKPETLIKYAEDHQLAPQAAVSQAYRHLKTQGFTLPDQAALLRTAGERVITELGIPRAARQAAPPAQVADSSQAVAERVERKQAMSPQPRRASILPQGEPSAPTMSKEQKDLRAVQQMRAFRRGR